MTGADRPTATTRAPNHLVASADHLATAAGTSVFARGGNAVDAAIAANAVLAVTAPHLCGLGGDLFALVHTDGEVHALNASGRAGSGADAELLRAGGHTTVPFRHHVAAVTVPGCVDGWCALHDRFGSLPLDDLVAPARQLALDGFPASPLLVGSLALADPAGRHALRELADQATHSGARVRRPGVARVLAEIAAGGRAAFYLGEFGEGLLALGRGVDDAPPMFVEGDLEQPGAEWVEPLGTSVFGVDLHTIPPNSQGYLTLGSAAIVDALVGSFLLPDDPDDPRWAHLLIEAACAAGHDRPDALHEHADGPALVREIADRTSSIDPDHVGSARLRSVDGDTTYLCAAGLGPDGRPMAVSLIQSNASGFGSHLVEPRTGINLHNRGLGFSLVPGHPAELGPGRRPPHTLSPALATSGGGLVAVLGTMGGDAQPQILLQLAVRLYHHRQSPQRAVDAGRFVLRGPTTGFDTWVAPTPTVLVEGHAAPGWADGLRNRGHDVETGPSWDSAFGHAHVITVDRDGMYAGAADPRSRVGSVAGG